MRKSAVELNRAIRESDEYIHYQKALQALKDCPELYDSVNQYRRRNYELQSHEDGVNRYREIQDLRIEYQDLLRSPLVNEFLFAEQILIRSLQDVYDRVADGLLLDYDYME